MNGRVGGNETASMGGSQSRLWSKKRISAGAAAEVGFGPKCRHSLLGFLIRISFSLGDTTGAGMPNACPKVGGDAAGVPSLLHLCSMPLPSWAPYGSQESMNLLTCVGH